MPEFGPNLTRRIINSSFVVLTMPTIHLLAMTVSMRAIIDCIR